MKILSERELKLNQLKVILIYEDDSRQVFYPHLNKNHKLERITRGKNIKKIHVEGTITSKNIKELTGWFSASTWSIKFDNEN